MNSWLKSKFNFKSSVCWHLSWFLKWWVSGEILSECPNLGFLVSIIKYYSTTVFVTMFTSKKLIDSLKPCPKVWQTWGFLFFLQEKKGLVLVAACFFRSVYKHFQSCVLSICLIFSWILYFLFIYFFTYKHIILPKLVYMHILDIAVQMQWYAYALLHIIQTMLLF